MSSNKQTQNLITTKGECMALTGFHCPVCGLSLREGATECAKGHKQSPECKATSLIVAIAEGAETIIKKPRKPKEDMLFLNEN